MKHVPIVVLDFGSQYTQIIARKLREAGVLRVGSSGDAPFAYIDEATGEFSGVDAEIIKEVAKRLGIAKTEMQLVSFSELILFFKMWDFFSIFIYLFID